jgi:hypothetical protein
MKCFDLSSQEHELCKTRLGELICAHEILPTLPNGRRISFGDEIWEIIINRASDTQRRSALAETLFDVSSEFLDLLT